MSRQTLQHSNQIIKIMKTNTERTPTLEEQVAHMEYQVVRQTGYLMKAQEQLADSKKTGNTHWTNSYTLSVINHERKLAMYSSILKTLQFVSLLQNEEKRNIDFEAITENYNKFKNKKNEKQKDQAQTKTGN